MSRYKEIKNEHPVLKDCFWAFSKEQFKEGVKKYNLEGKTLCNGGGGLIGTKEGILEMFNFYQERDERIKKECTPQEVYDYEFWNHECSYTLSDKEVLEIVESLFGFEGLKSIIRFKNL